MGIKSKADAAISAAFDGPLADAVTDFGYYDVSSIVYNSGDGGGSAVVNPSAPVMSRGVFEQITADKLEREVKTPVDMTLTVLQSEIPKKNFREGATIKADEFGHFEVLDYMADPADVTWTFYLKRNYLYNRP